MTKTDAELKAKALSKDLIQKIAEHKGSKRKCKIEAIKVAPKRENTEDFQVVCEFSPLNIEISKKQLVEELDYFLSTYRILS